MKYVVFFKDDPARVAERDRHMAAHLEFLSSNSDKIEAAGPLFAADGSGAGGLWLVDASDETEVNALVHADPFWPTGLRAGVEVMRWTRVFADGQRLR